MWRDVRITVDLEQCTRGKSPLSRCTRCQDACPQGAIDFVQQKSRQVPAFGPNCDECGQCAAHCPNAAIAVPKKLEASRRELFTGWFLRSPSHRPTTPPPRRSVTLPAACDQCSVCARLCPRDLLTPLVASTRDGMFRMDSDRCTGCRLCADVCIRGEVVIADVG